MIASLSVGAIGALLASQLFGLPLLTVYALSAGAAAEFARLAFQALMQRYAPPEALGRVFVRYEVLFQIAWVDRRVPAGVAADQLPQRRAGLGAVLRRPRGRLRGAATGRRNDGARLSSLDPSVARA